MAKPWIPVGVERREGDVGASAQAELVVEEPLEIRVAGETAAITMRTPGNDRELVLGFLWSEGAITSLDDVGALAHCGRTDDEGRGNTMEVTPSPGARIELGLERVSRRGTLTSSSCGVCGRRSIDDLLERCRPLPSRLTMEHGAISRAMASLRSRQTVFAHTGGCHAASLLSFAGEHVCTFEDVGRHNALDKLVGSRLLARALPLDKHLLVVSGRTSFDIVQKAVAAGISIVAGVSAASSLAVDLARRANLTLIGFARDQSLTIYSGGERVT